MRTTWIDELTTATHTEALSVSAKKPTFEPTNPSQSVARSRDRRAHLIKVLSLLTLLHFDFPNGSDCAARRPVDMIFIGGCRREGNKKMSRLSVWQQAVIVSCGMLLVGIGRAQAQVDIVGVWTQPGVVAAARRRIRGCVTTPPRKKGRRQRRSGRCRLPRHPAERSRSRPRAGVRPLAVGGARTSVSAPRSRLLVLPGRRRTHDQRCV